MWARLLSRLSDYDFLAVLLTPQSTFRRVAVKGRGFGVLLTMVALEFMLIHPLTLAGAAMRLSEHPLTALTLLSSQLFDYALGPLLLWFAAGIVLFRLLARRSEWRIEMWAAQSVLAYAWLPHLLLVTLGRLLAHVGLDTPLLPHHPSAPAETSALLLAGRWAVCYGPSLALGIAAVRALTSGPGPRAPFAAPWRAALTAGVVAALLLAGTSTAALTIALDWRRARPVFAGDMLGDFSLRGLAGGTLTAADLRGAVVLVDFWATWCPPCVAAMPDLERLHQRFGGKGFRLVSVNVEPDDQASVRGFLKSAGMTFSVYVDDGRLQRQLRVQSFPSAFLVDRRGTVRKTYIGSLSLDELASDVQGLLAE